MSQKLHYSFLKSSSEEVRILTEIKDNEGFIDVRVYRIHPRKGRFLPTTRGIHLSQELLPLLREGIEKLEFQLSENESFQQNF